MYLPSGSAKPGGQLMTIHVQDSSARWKTFLTTAKEDEILLLLTKQSQTPVLKIDFHELQSFDSEFADWILKDPRTVLDSGSKMLNDLCLERGGSVVHCLIRIGELPGDARIHLREIGSESIGKFCSVDVVVNKVSEIKPRLYMSTFKCETCGFEQDVEQKDERELKEPLRCPEIKGGCGSFARKGETTFQLMMQASKMINNQLIEVSELPENVPSGSQPTRGILFLERDLVLTLVPGDRISANVIPQVRPEFKRNKKTPMFEIVYDLISAEHESTPFTEIDIDDEDTETIIEISKRPDLLTYMYKSIAPSIFAADEKLEFVKRTLALQLFGGVSRLNDDGTRSRGDIHILLMGDPGVAKSQLLKYMSHISPRGKYASGGGVSAAGLTAAAVKDAFNDGRFALEAGILPLSDRGLAAIDEFDKITSSDRGSMHEAMEQQSIHIAKGGLTARLPTRCAVLAAANPKDGRFSNRNNRSSVLYSFQETGLPPPLASRFDVIWLLRDEIALQNDERIAKHILATRARGTTESMRDKGLIIDKPREDGITNIGVDGNEHLTTSFLRKYVAYAKLNVYPQLNEEARLLLLEFYRDERQAFYRDDQKEDYKDETSKVPITARALEALSRLAEAHARMHLRDIGTEKDARVAIAVFKHWRSEGNIEDESEFHSSRAAKRINPDKVVRQIITKLCEEKGEALIEEIYDASKKKEIKPFEVDRIIGKLRQGGILFSPRDGAYSFA